jgi:hypothetical protein
MANAEQNLRLEIGAEREQLVEAVTTLRAEVARATDVRSKVKAKLPLVIAGAVGIGFVAAGGIGRTVRLITHRGR